MQVLLSDLVADFYEGPSEHVNLYAVDNALAEATKKLVIIIHYGMRSLSLWVRPVMSLGSKGGELPHAGR